MTPQATDARDLVPTDDPGSSSRMTQRPVGARTVGAMIRTRVVVILLVTLATMVGAGAASATEYTVTTTADMADVNAADGLCDADAGLAGSQCSLRAAIQQANFATTADVINLPAGTYKIDKRTCGSARCDEEQAAEDDLDVKYPVAIHGAGA